jgi:hypothetical protein
VARQTRPTFGRGADRILAIALSIALLAPVVFPVAGLEMWGRLPDHGHASLNAIDPHHSHPGDPDHHDHDTVRDVEFTAGSVVGQMALPATIPSGLVLAGPSVRSARLPVVAPRQVPRATPEPPPPR